MVQGGTMHGSLRCFATASLAVCQRQCQDPGHPEYEHPLKERLGLTLGSAALYVATCKVAKKLTLSHPHQDSRQVVFGFYLCSVNHLLRHHATVQQGLCVYPMRCSPCSVSHLSPVLACRRV